MLFEQINDVVQNVGLMTAHRFRRWADVKPALDECLSFADVLTITLFLTAVIRSRIEQIYMSDCD